MEQHYLRGLVVGLVLLLALRIAEAGLSPNYYETSCPNVESIVRQAVEKKKNATVVTVPATLRLFFHDCFVEGCDASVLIASPNGDVGRTRRTTSPSAATGVFDTGHQAKEAVEAECPPAWSPGADILAIAPSYLDVAWSIPAHPVYAEQLSGVPAAFVDPTMAVNMDPVTGPGTSTATYSQNRFAGLGPSGRDRVLYLDTPDEVRARRTTLREPVAALRGRSRSRRWSNARAGRLKPENLGQIRRDCTTFN
ncbi:peroxidase 16-like [Ananas comosus]|uniref:Peroxidase 16-like n=1 Tax=Ananas comosus TaxID=4615 RepID=A0A6P5ELX2_ANACO|nr:peroxidase 16-like [Ananas comosus]